MALQHPTLRGVRVRTVDDARHIFYAVHQGQLPIITRRLSTEERLQIRPGDVYVWEEKTQHSVENSGLAIERWTDCFGWGPSRVRDDFLFYTQKEREQKRTNNRRNDMPPQQPGERWHKQTISMLVRDPAVASSIPRKWHMTAYFYMEDLPDVTHCAQLHNVPHPPTGMFERTKTRRDRGNSTNAASRAARASSSDSSDDMMAGPSRHDVRQKRATGRQAPYAPSASVRSTRDVSPALSSDSSAASHYHSNLPPMSATSGSSGLTLFDRPTLPPLNIGSSFYSDVKDHRYGEPPVSTFTSSRKLPDPSSLASRTPEYMMSYGSQAPAQRPVLGVPLVQTYRTPRRGEDDAVLRKFT